MTIFKKLFYFILLIFSFFTFFTGCETTKEDEKKYYNVTFIVNNNETSIKVLENTKINIPENLIDNQNDFIGWFLNNELYDFDTLVINDIVLVAVFNKYYDVTFIDDDKITISKVLENTMVEKPIDCFKEGYTFIGWFLEDELYDFNNLVSDNIKLEAKYQIIPILEISTTTNTIRKGEQIQINSEFFYTDELKLRYTVDKKEIVDIDSTGLITGLFPGIVTITAYHEYKKDENSLINNILYSNEITIEVLDEYPYQEEIDLKGHVITTNCKILDKDSLLYNIEERNDKKSEYIYNKIIELENKYNFKVEYKFTDDYYYKDLEVSRLTSTYYFNKDNVYDLTDLVNKYKDRYPLWFTDERILSFEADGKMPMLSLITRAFDNLTPGIYYCADYIKNLGLDDPLELYKSGRWTYSTFIKWCYEAKEILDEKQKDGQRLFDGIMKYAVLNYNKSNEVSFYCGLMNTIGIRIFDIKNKKINTSCDESLEIIKFLSALDGKGFKLYEREAELGTLTDALLNVYYVGMGAEYLNYIRYPNDELSVVPYPYPDDYDLSELYLSIGGAVPYVFPIKEQTNYPEGVTFEDIFVVMCDFFYQVNLYDFANKDTMKGIQSYMNNISQFSDNTIDVYSSFTSDKYFYEPIYSISNYYIILKNFIWYENFDLKEYVNMFESLKNDFIIYGLDNEEFYDNNGPVKDLGEN